MEPNRKVTATVLQKYKDCKFYRHNPKETLMRTTEINEAAFAQAAAEKLLNSIRMW